MDLTLEIVEGPGAGRQLIIDRPLTVGREPGVDVVLDDPKVSRRHAILSPGPPTGLVVEDLGSSNGTFVNGHEVAVPTAIAPGDEVAIGVTVLEVRTAAQATSTSAVRPIPPPLAIPAGQPSFVRPVGPIDESDLVPVPSGDQPVLDRLRDTRTKRRAFVAPLAIFVVVALVVIIYLGTR